MSVVRAHPVFRSRVRSAGALESFGEIGDFAGGVDRRSPIRKKCPCAAIPCQHDQNDDDHHGARGRQFERHGDDQRQCRQYRRFFHISGGWREAKNAGYALRRHAALR